MKLSTKTSETIEDWTSDQFSALLFLHAAHADFDYTDDERLKILEYISEDELCSLEEYYHGKTDTQILQIILKHKSQFYKTRESQTLLFQQLKSIFEADGYLSKLEQTQYAFLSRLIIDSES